MPYGHVWHTDTQAFPMENSCEASEFQPPCKGRIAVPIRLKLALETGERKCASSDANPSYLPRDDNKSQMKFYSSINKKDFAQQRTWVGFHWGDITLLARRSWPLRMAALWHDKCRHSAAAATTTYFTCWLKRKNAECPKIKVPAEILRG